MTENSGQSDLPPPSQPAEAATDGKKPIWKRWWAITLGVFVVLIVIASASGGGSDGDVATSETEAPVENEAPVETEAPVEPPAGEDADVGPCTLLSEDAVIFEVTNNSSKQSSYFIDVNFLDDAGQRVGDETTILNYLRPGETAVEEHFVFDTAGGTSCEIAEVDRFAAESNDDVAEVTCEITGVDFVDDLETKLVATNGSSKLSDYLISVTVTRDGVRVGSGFGSVENVKPGESAPGDGFSTTPGPAEGASCETVHVTRTDSST